MIKIKSKIATSFLVVMFLLSPFGSDATKQIDYDGCEGGGAPKKSCAYWNVTYSYTSGMLGSVTVTCVTGGNFTCE